jgi:glycosyltransferase involved in cell wall biosynthesis
MSGAMRAVGYETLTLVDERYVIHGPDDFDADTHTYLRGSTWRRVFSALLGDYAVFGWLLGRYDVFHYFFDGGFLRRTPLRFAEVQLLHLAGKSVVVMPYGSDVAVPSRIRSLEWRQGLMRNYPALGRDETPRLRRLDYFSRRADYVVACLVHLETLPRWDLLTIHYYPIDTEEWTTKHPGSENDGTNGPVRIVHAPNHRAMKGTDALIRACDALREEGLQIDLRLLERIPNAEVRGEIDRSDILAEQFLLGYGLTAVEGMSLSKAVLSNIGVEGYYEVFRHQTGFGDCPIVSATPESLTNELRRLVKDPGLRRALGAAGRRYVLREHSYDVMADLWTAIYSRVWHGDDVDPAELVSRSATADASEAPDPRVPDAPRVDEIEKVALVARP